MIRVLICNDQDVVREGLQAILGTIPEIYVIGVACNGAQAIEAVEQWNPDSENSCRKRTKQHQANATGEKLTQLS